ncbi:hypothetical protein FEZ48_06350 [Marinilactibacillus psychrotolerans]|uniref:Uncharacterized protein n=1 Tax=Marinilactibacillus psychrotolerans TaxID=191770 RepID=A0A5R9C431_9LACT|nr:hypothetical protein [Marinilactibacillus psychrotolerans]TLQ07598.1 hypothetical protein FEZ48_06350 [Marinilactibacillus psychrotolerans]
MEDNRQDSMHKDITLQRAKLAGEITTLAALITNSCDTDVFAGYSGHVDTFRVKIYPEGWRTRCKANEEITIECRIGGECDSFSLIDLYKIKRQLVQILKDKNVDYDRLDYTTETVTYKKYYLG